MGFRNWFRPKVAGKVKSHEILPGVEKPSIVLVKLFLERLVKNIDKIKDDTACNDKKLDFISCGGASLYTIWLFEDDFFSVRWDFHASEYYEKHTFLNIRSFKVNNKPFHLQSIEEDLFKDTLDTLKEEAEKIRERREKERAIKRENNRQETAVNLIQSIVCPNKEGTEHEQTD